MWLSIKSGWTVYPDRKSTWIKEDNVWISNIYHALEGEGILSGTPLVICRLSGCNIGCRWCDSPDARNMKSGKQMTVLEVYNIIMYKLEECGMNWVMITGGEPLLQMVEFCQLAIRLSALNIEVCTSGCIEPPHDKVRNIVKLWTVDHKCPSSGTSSNAIKQWVDLVPRNRICFKFVVQDERDLDYALRNKVDGRINILSPVTWNIKDYYGQVVIGQDQTEWNRRVADFAMRNGFRFSMQRHKMLFGQERQDT
jgi:organic radical activating enzyme